jgi:hypothetical protein
LMAGDDKVVTGSVKNLLQTIAARLAPEQFEAARHAGCTKLYQAQGSGTGVTWQQFRRW